MDDERLGDLGGSVMGVQSRSGDQSRQGMGDDFAVSEFQARWDGELEIPNRW